MTGRWDEDEDEDEDQDEVVVVVVTPAASNHADSHAKAILTDVLSA